MPNEPNDTKTCSPSVTGVGDAYEPSGRVVWCGIALLTALRQSSLPLARSKASTTNSCSSIGRNSASGLRRVVPAGAPTSFLPVETAVATKTCSPQTIGDASPFPGSGAFQRTFFVSLHSIGGDPLAAPLPPGPRQPAQSLVFPVEARKTARSAGILWR